MRRIGKESIDRDQRCDRQDDGEQRIKRYACGNEGNSTLRRNLSRCRGETAASVIASLHASEKEIFRALRGSDNSQTGAFPDAISVLSS